MEYIYMYSTIVSLIGLAYSLFDVGYYLRLAFTLVYGHLFHKKRTFDETTEIHSICTSQDLDIFLTHMNNARYVRELDFARYHFSERTGMYKEFKELFIQTAATIRYRRAIPFGSMYKITTRIINWDEQNLYVEQQYVTTSDDFIRAIVISTQRAPTAKVAEIMSKITGKDVSYRPKPPEEFEDYIKCIKKSSERLNSNLHSE